MCRQNPVEGELRLNTSGQSCRQCRSSPWSLHSQRCREPQMFLLLCLSVICWELNWGFLMVQWLRLWASNLGSILGQGIKIPHATWYGQKRKRKKNPPWEDPTVERVLVFCAYGWEKLLGLAVESTGPPGPPGGWQVLTQGGMGKRTDSSGYNPWS